MGIWGQLSLKVGRYAKFIAKVIALVRTANEAWFDTALQATNVQSGSLTAIRLQVSLDTASVIEISLDDGATWDALFENVALKINTLYEFYIDVEKTDQINFRAKLVVTVKRARMDQLL